MPDRSGTVLFKKSEKKANRNPLTFTQTLTSRGFGKVLFQDYYDNKCSMQVSSVGTNEYVYSLALKKQNPKFWQPMQLGSD